MGDAIEITTTARQPKSFYHISSSALSFEVKGSQCAGIYLNKSPSSECDILVVLGDNNNRKSYIKSEDRKETITTTPDILSPNEYRKFWITWFDGVVHVGRDAQVKPFLSCKFSRFFVNYVSFNVLGAHDPLHWKFQLPPIKPKYLMKSLPVGEPKWVPAPDRKPPENAIVAGFEGELLYLIRAEHMGSLTPGKFRVCHNAGYIPWGGHAHRKKDLQFLCGFNYLWIPTFEDRIPNGSLVAGHSETNQETLYVGRAYHDGCLVPGKVQPSHKCCYIPYLDGEVCKKKYEILVYPEIDPRCITGFKSNTDSGDEYYDDAQDHVDGDSDE